MFVHSFNTTCNLLRLHTKNVNRSNERKWSHTKKARSRQYPAETITVADYTDDLVLLMNASVQAECLLNSLEKAARSIGCNMNS